MGKAKRRTDVMDVIKFQKRVTKKAAGMKRQLASGTAYTHRSAMAATKTLGSGAGSGPEHNSGDLEMHTYDIKDVDRLKFSVTRGSEDELTVYDTGMEAMSYYDPDTDTQYTLGMRFQIPKTSSGLNSYIFNIGADGGSSSGTNRHVFVITDNTALFYVPVNTPNGFTLPYISNTTNAPADAVVDGWFNNANGSMGIQYYETSGQTRIWVKANDTWQKTYAT